MAEFVATVVGHFTDVLTNRLKSRILNAKIPTIVKLLSKIDENAKNVDLSNVRVLE
jgi:hypothetical protein